MLLLVLPAPILLDSSRVRRSLRLRGCVVVDRDSLAGAANLLAHGKSSVAGSAVTREVIPRAAGPLAVSKKPGAPSR